MIPIPNRMQHLRLDRRGYPIPWSVFCDGTGHPHFAINDDIRRFRALLEQLCPICGKRLLRGRWFAGGPMSAFHPQGAYIDPPMHAECMRYAMQVCPYLAAPHYAKRIDDKTLGEDRPPLLIDETSVDRRPPVFVAVLAAAQKLVGTSYSPNVIPCRPYLRIEYWRHGVKLSDTEGEQLIETDRATWDELYESRQKQTRLIVT